MFSVYKMRLLLSCFLDVNLVCHLFPGDHEARMYIYSGLTSGHPDALPLQFPPLNLPLKRTG